MRGGYGLPVLRVPNLGEVDLSAVLGLELTAAARRRIVELGQRIDQLRLAPQEPSCEPLDWLELALEVWHASDSPLLVTAAAEVACFCPTNHNMHTAGESEWPVRTENELLNALDAAVECVAAWARRGASPDEWRCHAGLPGRPGA